MAATDKPRGHDVVLDRLAAAWDRGRLPHALLFSGPSGIGKSRAARWLSTRAMCSADERPCFACAACMQNAAGSHPDLHVVTLQEGKKEIGIDAIRQMRRFVNLAPASAGCKVGIVVDAERLSIAAQNALLKTLEEPPADSTIFLVSARPGSLLPTVRSRTQKVVFAPLAADIVARILEAEGLPGDEALALAKSSDGSPGRAFELRGLLARGVGEELGMLLADLHPSRYLPSSRFAAAMGKTEKDMTAHLELLQFRFRDAAAEALRQGNGRAAATAAREAALVAEALSTLRRRNPNRPLLAEALATRLARLCGGRP